MITRTFKLCLNAGTGSAPFINVSQTDKDEVWLFELYTETGERYTPSSGAIIGIKADGHGIANTGTVDSEGRVVITETEQITAAAGRAIYELSIDGLTHGTANFIVNVEKKPIDGAIMSDSDLSLISQAIDSAAEIEDLLDGQDVPTVITPIITDWLEDNITNPSNPPIDTSLTVAGAAADAKATGDEISDLKNALHSVQKAESVDITPTTNNKFIKNSDGTIVDAGSVSYYISSELNVTEGERYKISLMMHFNNAVVAFYDSVGTFISSIPASTGTASGSNYIFTDYEFTVPASASKMRLGFYTYSFTVQRVHETFSSHPAWYGKKWACLGDSLTAENTATTKHYFDYVAEDTGIIPVNLGVNGTGYARSSASGDPFYNRIDTIPTDSDVVTIFGSFNDIGSGLEFGDVDDTGTETIAGCINTTITNLQTRIPLVNLGIVAPTPWDTTRPNFVVTSNSYKYVNLLKMICERRSIPFLDLWHCSNLRPWDADFRAIAYSNDGGSGTHPDENGHKLIAPRFEWFLSSLLLG